MREKQVADEYNLLDEKWISVLTNEGEVEQVSLLQIFEYAHKYKTLANELPTVDVAIARLLLAIMYGALLTKDKIAHILETSDVTKLRAIKLWYELYSKKALMQKLSQTI